MGGERIEGKIELIRIAIVVIFVRNGRCGA